MKKKLIFALSSAILAGGLSFGIMYEAKSQDTFKPPFCDNGVVKGKKVFGVCMGTGDDCFRCEIF
ncbi:hypothetical protein QYS48_12900 [Marivirga arenosa]|uniref:Uncharacterized protein n=1 Tax=Marivirga arenosa TaxID=3059076 RepID=A0AA49GHG4_9BACT|nr:hypothetical protein [Marivirga sp. ABR2-2]WKK87526.1 hypothetical protein QYS48_12900 [Marivirga sp. ABR2-2]